MERTFKINYQENKDFDLLAAKLTTDNNLAVNAKRNVLQNFRLSFKNGEDIVSGFIEYVNTKIANFEFQYNSKPTIKGRTVDITKSKSFIFLVSSGNYNSVNSLRFEIEFKLNEQGEIIKILYMYNGSLNQIYFEGVFNDKDIDLVLYNNIQIFDYYHKKKLGLI